MSVFDTMDETEVNIVFGSIVLCMMLFTASPASAGIVIGIAVIAIVLRRVTNRAGKKVREQNAELAHEERTARRESQVKFAGKDS